MMSGGVFIYKIGGRVIKFVKPSDVVIALRVGFGDVGFVGSDKVVEKQLGNEWVDIATEPIADAKCQLVIAASDPLRLSSDYPMSLITTSYPNTTTQWYKENGLKVPDLFVVGGSVEAYASPGSDCADAAPDGEYAHAVVDVRGSGKTLIENGLPFFKPISEPIKTLAVRLANR